MAQVKVTWRETVDHEAVFEIRDETYTASVEQQQELLGLIEVEAPSGTAVSRQVEIDEVETLRKGTEVPAINRPIYEPEF